jgi:ubiquinone/menaquinone biosynthesis C-methylase UbiE
VDPLKDKLGQWDGGRILDVATGHGQFLKLLTASFAEFTEAVGIDMSERMIDIARRECDDGFRYQVMDGENIEFEDGFFDTVAIRHSLHHLAHVHAVMTEMKRVLRPGGLFIVCEVFQSPDSNKLNSQRHLHHWWAAVDRFRGLTHNETFTRREIIRITDRLSLAETETIEHLEEYDNSRIQNILGQMIKKCRNELRQLQEGDAPVELIRTGEDLIERFTRFGLSNEAVLYVLGRKAC